MSKREVVVAEGKLSPSRERDLLSTSSNNNADEPLQNARLVWFPDFQEEREEIKEGWTAMCGVAVLWSSSRRLSALVSSAQWLLSLVIVDKYRSVIESPGWASRRECISGKQVRRCILVEAFVAKRGKGGLRTAQKEKQAPQLKIRRDMLTRRDREKV